MLESRANILLLIPNLGPGGAQRVFHDHSLALSKQYQVYECVFNTDDGIAFPTQNKLINLKVPAGSTVWRKIYYFWLRCRRLKQVKKQYNISVCISHLEGADYINILSKSREKVVLCIHGSKLHDLNIVGIIGWIRKKIFMRRLYNIADKIVTVSRDINAELINGLGVKPDKVQTINNFFYVSSILHKANQPLTDYQKLFDSKQTIVTSGRLALQKNQAPLLLIFSKLLKTHACKLIFLGDGELRSSLIQYSRELGLKVFAIWDNQNYEKEEFDIYFLGYQQNPFQYIKNATVFAFPSAWEGFPMALCEAMICGVPVVTTDCPTGPREILAPKLIPNQKIVEAEFAEYGILMPMLYQPEINKSTDIWVETLKLLLTNSDMRLHYSGKAQLRMLDFTPDKIIHQWQQVIENV